MQRHLLRILLAVVYLFGFNSLEAKVTMPGIFTDNMVLQRDQSVNVWGWADMGETVEVSFNGQKKKTKIFSLRFQRTEKVAHDATYFSLQLLIVVAIQHRRIIFVYK